MVHVLFPMCIHGKSLKTLLPIYLIASIFKLKLKPLGKRCHEMLKTSCSWNNSLIVLGIVIVVEILSLLITITSIIFMSRAIFDRYFKQSISNI